MEKKYKKYLKKGIDTNNMIFKWYMFILYYFLLRLFFGIEYLTIYFIVIVIILLGISFGYGALIFFLIAMIVYGFGLPIEANHYMSFVYGFMFLFLLKNIFIIFKDRFTQKND
jgi:hypothetical protein